MAKVEFSDAKTCEAACRIARHDQEPSDRILVLAHVPD